MSSKHIIGIGQLEPGKVAIIHGNALQCDHAVPMLQECPLCLHGVSVEDKGVPEAEMRSSSILA